MASLTLNEAGANEITLFAVFDGTTKTGLQESLELISDAPVTSVWDWSPQFVSDFGGRTADISFAFENDGVGESNELHSRAKLTFEFDTDLGDDWSPTENTGGSFVIRLHNGVEGDVFYSVSVTLRSVVEGYTVIEGQSKTLGGNGISAAGAVGFTVTSSFFSWIKDDADDVTPETPSLVFDALGKIVDYNFDPSPYLYNGTFVMTIQDGTRPASVINGVHITVRSLIGDGYTLIDGQTSGEDGINGAGAHGFQFLADFFSWPTAPGITGNTLNFTGMAAVDGTPLFTGATWTEAGTCRMEAQDGDRPKSYIIDRPLNLRQLIGDGYTIIDGQTSGDNGINLPGVHGFEFFPSFYDWPTAVTVDSLNFTDMAAVDGAPLFSGTSWSEDGTFCLLGRDGTRPGSYVAGRGISLRKLIGDGYTVIQGQSAGGDGITAAGVHGFSFEANIFNWDDAPSTHDMAFSPMGALTAHDFGDAKWHENGDFVFKAWDAPRPASYIPDRVIALRRIPTIAVPYFGPAPNVNIQNEAGQWWNWMELTPSMSATGVTPTTGESDVGMPIAVDPKSPGDYGTAEIELQKGTSGNPLRPSCTVTVPIYVKFWIWGKWFFGSYALAQGRARMRYQTELQADALFTSATERIVWSLNLSGTALNGSLGLVSSLTDSVDNVLQTPFDDVTTGYLPNVDGTYTVTLSANKVREDDHDVVLVPSETVELTLQVLPTHDNVNVAVLLDRSGSMSSQERWNAACSGAGSFAALLSMFGDEDANPHKLGIYWFNSDYLGSDPTGTFLNGDGDHYGIVDGVALSDATDVGMVCAGESPNGATGLGEGLLLCKGELNNPAVDTGAEEKVILVLSDGMENQTPLTATVFPEDMSSGPWDDPNIRIYPLALMTGTTWVDRLRDIVTKTGGNPAVDVKHIQTWSDADTPVKINDWFISMFNALFGCGTIVGPPDPSLSKNQTGVQPVQVNSGQSKLVFYCTHDEPRPEDWQLEVRLPGGAATITRSVAECTDGIQFFETKMTKMIVVDFPLRIPGCEHVWIGQWTMAVTRVGNGTRHYGVGALAKQAMGLTVDVLSTATPVPGDTAAIRARLTDRSGKPVTDATVRVEVTEPGSWIGDYLTQKARRSPELFRKVSRSKSAANRDVENTVDRFIQHLIGKRRQKPGTTRRKKMTHIGNGIYETSFRLRVPGEHNLDVMCAGYRLASKKESVQRKKVVLGEVQKNLKKNVMGLKAREKSAYKKRATTLFAKAVVRKQRYSIEARNQLAVRFVPDEARSTRYGFVNEDGTLFFHIEPRDKYGRYLGPGWADAIRVVTPASFRIKWTVTDMLDGTYEVAIPFKLTSPYLGVKDNALGGNRLSLAHPEHRARIRPPKPSLPLKGFSMEVLDITMPVTVFAIAGNKTTREAHLVTCRHVASISDENFEWFENMDDVKKHGYDTCESCMPLIGNSATKETHKPLCSHVRRIKVSNRKEFRSWSVAKKQGYDGCRYCLPKKHTR